MPRGEALPLADHSSRKAGNTSFLGAVTAMLKLCIGVGVLSVPHAFSTGGVVPCVLALLVLLVWNDWAGQRLVLSRNLLDEAARRRVDAGRESPFAALAREAAGGTCAAMAEAVLFVLMFGVAVSYLVALHDFIRATPLAVPLGVDVAAAAAIAVPLALVDDMGSLAAVGAAGLVALACSLTAIALYGVARRETLGWAQNGAFDWTKPNSTNDLGAAVGVMAFCFGIAPLALQMEASMASPDKFAGAQRVALTIAFATYLIVGAGVARLYDGPGSNDAVPGNVLDALPDGRWTVPTAVRLAMACASMFSVPIGLVGCGEILEARFPRCRRVYVRGLVAVGAALVAHAMPAFCLVVGLVGAFCCITLGFVLPPLVHLLLARRNGLSVREDAVLFVLGILLVVATTTLTARTTAEALAATNAAHYPPS